MAKAHSSVEFQPHITLLGNVERIKRRGIHCHLKPMASGSAVRADHPFEDVQVPVRVAPFRVLSDPVIPKSGMIHGVAEIT